MIRESSVSATPGVPVLLLGILGILVGVTVFIMGAAQGSPMLIIVGVLAVLLSIFTLIGLFMVAPNQGKVLQLFGDYRGTVRSPGLRWANPFYSKANVSLRVRNFETGKLKVNDKDGNPIEIATVVVWKVVDTAEAVFEVDDFKNYVAVQSEAALRSLATGYTYDTHNDGDISLSGNTSKVSDQLKDEVQGRLAKAGVNVIEARISHLAYAPEIAAAMLQRQQASAVVAARTKIVEGAVGMVDLALDQLSTQNILELDDERKASMVSNLMVVLCSDRSTQPIINTGSMYQ